MCRNPQHTTTLARSINQTRGERSEDSPRKGRQRQNTHPRDHVGRVRESDGPHTTNMVMSTSRDSAKLDPSRAVRRKPKQIMAWHALSQDASCHDSLSTTSDGCLGQDPASRAWSFFPLPRARRTFF